MAYSARSSVINSQSSNIGRGSNNAALLNKFSGINNEQVKPKYQVKVPGETKEGNLDSFFKAKSSPKRPSSTSAF